MTSPSQDPYEPLSGGKDKARRMLKPAPVPNEPSDEQLAGMNVTDSAIGSVVRGERQRRKNQPSDEPTHVHVSNGDVPFRCITCARMRIGSTNEPSDEPTHAKHMPSDGELHMSVPSDTHKFDRDILAMSIMIATGGRYDDAEEEAMLKIVEQYADKRALEARLNQLYAVGNTFFPGGMSDGSKNADWLEQTIKELKEKL